MDRQVVVEMAPLAEPPSVLHPVVTGCVVEVRGGADYPKQTRLAGLHQLSERLGVRQTLHAPAMLILPGPLSHESPRHAQPEDVERGGGLDQISVWLQALFAPVTSP